MTERRRDAGTVFLDGRFVASAAARISPFDRGFLYGDGLFETIRVYEGQPYALAEHLERMRSAAKRVHLPVPHALRWWRSMTRELLRRNRLSRSEAAVRITITRGLGREGLLPVRRRPPTIFATAWRLPPDLAQRQQKGVAVALLPFHPGLGGYLSGVKTTDYLTALIGKTFARERGAFEGIYTTRSGHLLEGTTSNVFLVRRDTLITPAVDEGILAGITRRHVIDLARRTGIQVVERKVLCRELTEGDGAFLTASTIEIVPISSVGGRAIARCVPMTRRLGELFASARKSEG